MNVEISEPQTAYPVEGGAGSRDDWRPLSLEEARKQHIQRVLAMCKGNRLRAAQVLGMATIRT
jgi:ActR/RegA family two-component response regulator